MNIYPAIDIRGGRVTRLREGKFDTAVTYGMPPLTAARGFMEQGAKHLHVVDLDGAEGGKPRNASIIREIIKETDMYVEVGGGIRDVTAIETYLSAGAGRCIIGTAAVSDKPFLKNAVYMFKDRVAVGVDARDGKVAVRGWVEVTETDAAGFCETLCDMGVKTVIYTDISKDGMLSGPNVPVYKELKRIHGLEVIASGGVTTIADVAALKAAGADGVIIGKALYAGMIDLKEALALC